MADNGTAESKSPKSATLDRMAELGITVEPPAGWQRFWGWWWIRCGTRVRLARSARRLGGYRGRLLQDWFVGSEAVGPYSLGVLTVQQGRRQDVLQRLAKRALRHGYRPVPSPVGADASGLSLTVAPGRPVVSLTTYGPGEQPVPGGAIVSANHTVVIMTLTNGCS